MNEPQSSAEYGCILCPDPERARIPYRPPVCDSCRRWLPTLLGDLRILAERLAQPETSVRDVRVAPVRGKGGYAVRDDAGNLLLRWRDPVAHANPAGPICGQVDAPRVAGSREAPVPINLTAVDLTLRAQQGSLGPHARGVLGKDAEQVGDLPVATVLEMWVRDLRQHRNRGEALPDCTVPALTRWLTDRADEACDDYPELVELTAQMRSYRSALRRVLGEQERPDYKVGVACPKCSTRTLFRRNGEIWIECASCPTMLSPEEYEELTGEQSDDATRAQAA